MDHGSGSRVGRQFSRINLFQLFRIHNSSIQVGCQDFEHVSAVFLIGAKTLKRQKFRQFRPVGTSVQIGLQEAEMEKEPQFNALV